MGKPVGFSYQNTADGCVRIFHHGRLAATLARAVAAKFLEKAQMAGEEDLQLLMAKATGNYKHGNEKNK
jgi:hypothetical protein